MRKECVWYSILALCALAPACVGSHGREMAFPWPGQGVDPIEELPDFTDNEAGCHETTFLIHDLMIIPTSVSTVLRVTWETSTPSIGYVVFTTSAGLVESTHDPAPVTSHEALLMGIGPQTDAAFRVVADFDGDVDCSEEYRAETGVLPVDLPWLDVEIGPPGGTPAPFQAVPIINQGGSTCVILDASGHYVWYDLSLMSFRFVRSLDGQAMILNTPSFMDPLHHVIRIGFDGVVQQDLAIPDGHTDFVEISNGRYAVLGWDVRETEDGRKLLGDTILEVTAGGITEIWNVWDWFEPDLAREYDAGFYPPDPGVEDWSHFNSITYDPLEDAFFVTSLKLGLVARIDYPTGDLEWALGTGLPDFDQSEAPDMVSSPHSIQFLGNDEFLLFNHRNPANLECSDVRRFSIDDNAMKATETWRNTSDECLMVSFLGNAWQHPNGSMSISWSSAGQLQEITPEGSNILRISLPAGNAFGYAQPLDSLY